jgi:hypothetical protein
MRYAHKMSKTISLESMYIIHYQIGYYKVTDICIYNDEKQLQTTIS